MRSRPLYDVVAVLVRLGVGVVFMAHGWQKIEAGVTATSHTFDGLGVPLPTAAAVYSAFVELLGGAALIAGLGLPVTGVLLFVDMAGAFIFIHADQGLFMVDGTTVQNGYELVLALGMASLLFAAGGGGRLTLDQWIIGKRLRRPDDDDEDDAASFVESLRQAEGKPPKKPRPPRRPKTPDPAPQPTEDPTKPEGSEDDVLVAGTRKASHRRRSSTTQPIKRGPADDKDPST
ncbi:DoxX family protein [Actinomadura darangshiensis]|uniref:DoxX family protein n=1 Tax=Actinomadura darangshiensis TaxID=705336 RepID=A0A4R5A7I4_9ACTN|nr:DoxX family protein [Actinomadura darangshiensis]TDD66779.1 DoxX family protein [Actinomadura darangshiensis]